MNDADDQFDIWDELLSDLKDGKTVYVPVEKTKIKKRKRRLGSLRKPKKRNANSQSDCDFISVDESESQASDSEPEQDRGEPLYLDQVEGMIRQIKDSRKEARREGDKLNEEAKEVRNRLKDIKDEQVALKATMNAICIAGRNQYSRGAIRQDFAAGIKELDQENAVEEDEENFNPDVDYRDYEHIAQSLPVFCVSSRAYQKLCGRLKKDSAIPGFKTVDETEVPALQAHCRKMTEAGRAVTSHAFLSKLAQMLISLNLWATSDGSGIKLSDEDRATETGFLKQMLKQLEDGLEKAVRNCTEEVRTTLAENIYDKFDVATKLATDAALPTSEKWGARRDLGGLVWSSYKAVCRRNGVFTNAKGLHDFNAQLAEPLMKCLASGWETAFNKKMPQVLAVFSNESSDMLQHFHTTIDQRAREHGVGLAGLYALEQQPVSLEQQFQHLAAALVEMATKLQRDANRAFTPTIAMAMMQAYELCTNESGTGSFTRMKSHMAHHIDYARRDMFDKSTEQVRMHLDHMCRQIQDNMELRADQVFLAVERDYTTVIGGVPLPEGYIMPREEKGVRDDVADAIAGSDEQFRKILGVEKEDEEMQEGNVGQGEGPEDAEEGYQTTREDENGDEVMKNDGDEMMVDAEVAAEQESDGGLSDGEEMAATAAEEPEDE
ncbi:hypothetical protein LTS18_009470 [Coniosporium uncinatum]|uniref:Uncharacterized protein n=1 Tax=Coniosporium uncinatum TaxID=93489 RepID=A0ACC3DAC2_9PEZI|nr:hypothetical protein LTS18_009470 [Coniosporium uncinatum]